MTLDQLPVESWFSRQIMCCFSNQIRSQGYKRVCLGHTHVFASQGQPDYFMGMGWRCTNLHHHISPSGRVMQ